MRDSSVPNATLQIIRDEHGALAAVLRSLSAQDWSELDVAFETSRDALAGGTRDPAYDGLFTRIVLQAPAPIGVGAA
jgi:hypothetical protein